MLDPFMGSGTTPVAAYLERRDSIGIESDPDFYEYSNKRFATTVSEGRDVELTDIASILEAFDAD